MNESRVYRTDEIEVSIADMFWSVLKHWRSIIVFMLIFGVIIGGYSFIKEYKDYRDPAKRQKSQETYEQAVETYENKKEKLEKEIDNAKKLQEKLDYFKEHGIYLKIDPYNLYKIEATYYVDSHYEIMPNSSYQNPNNLIALIRSYRTAINRMDLETVIDMGGEDLTLVSPVGIFSTSNIFSLSVDESAGLMQLSIVADTQERAEKIYSTIEGIIADNHDFLVKVIGEHEVNKTNEWARYTLDYSWETMQNSFDEDQYEKNLTTIETKEKNLAELEAPKNEVLSKTSVLKKGIKGGVIGLVAGLVVAAIVYAVWFLIGGRLNNPDEIRNRYNVPLLGSIDQNNKKHLGLDKLIASKLGIDQKMTAEQSAKLIASNIKLYLKGSEKLLLIGNAGSNAADKLKNQLSPYLGDTEIVSSGNINIDPAAVDALEGDTAVVCVEEWQKSRHLDIVKELEKLRASSNQRTGFIIVY